MTVVGDFYFRFFFFAERVIDFIACFLMLFVRGRPTTTGSSGLLFAHAKWLGPAPGAETCPSNADAAKANPYEEVSQEVGAARGAPSSVRVDGMLVVTQQIARSVARCVGGENVEIRIALVTVVVVVGLKDGG